MRGTLAGPLVPGPGPLDALTAANVTLTGANLTVAEVAVRDVAANLTIADGTASLTDVRLVTDRGTFTGRAGLGADELGANGWTAEGRIGDATAAIFDFIPTCVRPPERLLGRAGMFSAAGRARGSAAPWGLDQARAEVRGAGLRLFSLPVRTLSTDLQYEDKRVVAADLRIEIDGPAGDADAGGRTGGTLSGIAAVDFDRPDLPLTADLTLTDLDLARFPADLLPDGFAVTGTLSANGRLDLRFPPPPDPNATDPLDPCIPRRGFRVAAADGTVSLDAPTLFLPHAPPPNAPDKGTPNAGERPRIALGTATAKIGVADGARVGGTSPSPAPDPGSLTEPPEWTPPPPRMRTTGATPGRGGGRITGDGAVGLTAPHQFRAKLRWDDWPTDSFLPPLLTAAGFPPPPRTGPDASNRGRRGTALGLISAAGTLVPFEVNTAEGVLRAADVRLPGLLPTGSATGPANGPGASGTGLTVPSLAAEFALTPQQLTVRSVDVLFSPPPGEPGEPGGPEPGGPETRRPRGIRRHWSTRRDRTRRRSPNRRSRTRGRGWARCEPPASGRARSRTRGI